MQQDTKDCVVLAVSVAEGMLRSGGEAYRAEECCESILRACGAENISVVTITTAIMVSADLDGKHRTEIISVKSRGTDLDGIERYNSISRRISAGTLDVEGAFAEIEAKRTVSPWHQLLFGALSSACFTFTFGGSIKELLPVFIAALAAQLFLLLSNKIEGNGFIATMGACMITAAIARFSVWLFPSLNQEAIIVSGILSMLPGLAMTNALRNIIHGDIISGLTRGTEALLTAIVIAAGVVIALAV